MVTFIRSGQAQVEIAAAMALQELRGMVAAIRDGAAPIPPRQAGARAGRGVEPAPETRAVFMMRPQKYLADGKTPLRRASMTIASMPLQSLKSDPLRCCRVNHRRAAAVTCVAHAAVTSTCWRPTLSIRRRRGAVAAYIGPEQSDLARASFTRVYRGPDRNISIRGAEDITDEKILTAGLVAARDRHRVDGYFIDAENPSTSRADSRR